MGGKATLIAFSFDVQPLWTPTSIEELSAMVSPISGKYTEVDETTHPVRVSEQRKPVVSVLQHDGWINAQNICRPRFARRARTIADWTVQKSYSVSRLRNRWE